MTRRLSAFAGLKGAFEIYRECLSILENNDCYRTTVLCEPQLGKRGLYPSLSMKGSAARVREMMNIIAYCDGRNDLIKLADIVDLPASRVIKIMQPLISLGLIERLANVQN